MYVWIIIAPNQQQNLIQFPNNELSKSYSLLLHYTATILKMTLTSNTVLLSGCMRTKTYSKGCIFYTSISCNVSRVSFINPAPLPSVTFGDNVSVTQVPVPASYATLLYLRPWIFEQSERGRSSICLPVLKLNGAVNPWRQAARPPWAKKRVFVCKICPHISSCRHNYGQGGGVPRKLQRPDSQSYSNQTTFIILYSFKMKPLLQILRCLEDFLYSRLRWTFALLLTWPKCICFVFR